MAFLVLGNVCMYALYMCLCDVYMCSICDGCAHKGQRSWSWMSILICHIFVLFPWVKVSYWTWNFFLAVLLVNNPTWPPSPHAPSSAGVTGPCLASCVTHAQQVFLSSRRLASPWLVADILLLSSCFKYLVTWLSRRICQTLMRCL